jgi:hypothetical protein
LEARGALCQKPVIARELFSHRNAPFRHVSRS